LSFDSPMDIFFRRPLARDASRNGPRHRQRIDMTQTQEVRYWADRIGVSIEELKKIVDQVGPMVTDVAKHLASTARPGAAPSGVALRQERT
jgi:hypothetical protein